MQWTFNSCPALFVVILCFWRHFSVVFFIWFGFLSKCVSHKERDCRLVEPMHQIRGYCQWEFFPKRSLSIHLSVQAFKKPKHQAHTSSVHEVVAKVSSAAEDQRMIASEDDMRVLNDVISKVSLHVVKDLLPLGICIGCIFRLLGVRGHFFSCPSLLLSILCLVIGEPTDSSTHRYTRIGENEDWCCPFFLRIIMWASDLQHLFRCFAVHLFWWREENI